MACTSCGGAPIITLQSFAAAFSSNCVSTDPTSGCGSTIPQGDSNCTVYSGPNLPCSGINTNDSVQTALTKIDTKLCGVLGNYSVYNTYCLAPITTQQQFVESISNYVCTLQANYNTFTNTTYPAYQTTLNTRFGALEVPGITCISAGVTSVDSRNTVLSKYCTKFATYDTALDLSTVNWSTCYTVSPAPTTIAAGFNALLSQICNLKTASSTVTLPTFNNTGTCLPLPVSSADTLQTTIGKITTQLCLTPTFNINTLTWNCVTKPSTTTQTDLQSAFAAVLSKLDTISQNLPSFSGDFVVAAANVSQPCQGKLVSLSSSPYADKYVGATPTDGAPGTLQDKLIAGTNLTLDFTTTPGKVILNSTGGSSIDQYVRTSSSDTTSGYLNQKVIGGSDPNGLLISVGVTTGNQLAITPSVNLSTFVAQLMVTIANNPTLLTQFCALVSSCPSPCSAPTNINVTYNSGITSTTTTTTSTTGSSTTTTTTTV